MRTRFLLAGAVALMASACADDGVISPADDGVLTPPPPAFAIVDAGSGGEVPGFWFLPPLAKQVTTSGTLDPNLEPGMEVCELAVDANSPADPAEWTSVTCVDGDTGTPEIERIAVVAFGPGTATITESEYAFSWKTSEEQMDADKFYRIFITLGGVDLGYFDINPQRPAPESPGADLPGLYAFRLGETLPVKFFLTPQTRCVYSENFVIQCTASAVVNNDGAVVTLYADEEDWSKLSVVVPNDALPDGYDQVILTMERIDPLLLAQDPPIGLGEECIPLFDAPLFADCLRVTTEPDLGTDLLRKLAKIEICIDFNGDLPEGLDDRFQIIRYEEGVWQALPNVAATTCNGTLGSMAHGLLPVPDDGLLRYAALGVNRVARLLGPQPLAAHGEIRLAGATSEFSRFEWGLLGEMVPQTADILIQQQEDPSQTDYDHPVSVLVQDATCVDDGTQCDRNEPAPIVGATVHFQGDDAVSPADALTGTDGTTGTMWTVPSALGDHFLTASGRGLLNTAVPDHANLINLTTPPTLSFKATVVGGPSGDPIQSPDEDPPLTGLPGTSVGTLTITVNDANGLPVQGWSVDWDCGTDNPDCDSTLLGQIQPGSLVTDATGSASGTWILGTMPGPYTVTATVGGLTATWHANAICQVDVNGIMEGDEWACAEAAGDTAHFVANISGGDAPAIVYWQSYGDSLYLAVKVAQVDEAKANSVRFDFDRGLGSAVPDNSHDPLDDAIGVDVDKGVGLFYDEYLTAKCANSSQSGCGALDPGGTAGQNGQGAFANVDGYTMFELSKALNSGQAEDFALSSGDVVGFFLTLRNGNGAQGNTQWPGFRVFEQITIR